MNTKHLFLWNVLEAWKLQISNDVENSKEPFKEFEKLTLYVDPDEKQTKIRQIVTGPVEDIVIIEIKQSKSQW